MKRTTAAVLVALLTGLSAQSAHAAGADAQTSGTVSITVEIPPFAAGLAAQAEGAVGLWTMVDNQSTLMVKLPDTVSNADGDVEAAIFTAVSTPFSLSVVDAAMNVALQQPTVTNGLVRHGFTLRRSGSIASASEANRDTATFVIAGV